MDKSTIYHLNSINQRFYQTTAKEFDQTRGGAWAGWGNILEVMKPDLPHDELSILDVGCGNGRFAVFLAEHLPNPIRYVGIDSDASLLGFARNALGELPNVDSELLQSDILDSDLNFGTFHWVVLFGVMHHIPGYATRLHLIRQLASNVKSDGYMSFACWRFYEYERFRRRIIPWDSEIQVEKHDYLLDWRQGEQALRYCHYVDDAEHNAIVEASGLYEVSRFRADGKTNDANCYSILQKRS